MAGYEDVNDAARLSQDPTFRLIGSRKIRERGAALTSRLQSFEIEVLTQKDNLAGLAALNRELVARVGAIASPRRIVLDMDSTEVRVHGRQEHSAYNGRFESTCYHPLLLFNREGDCLAAKLRGGNVHSADSWEELLLPEIDRQQAQGKEVAFRGDAAFAEPELYEVLEAREVKYAIRLPANDNLQRKIAELLIRPVGRPSHKPVFRFRKFSLSGSELDHEPGGWWRKSNSIAGNCSNCSPAWVHRDQSWDFKPGGGASFYNKCGAAKQWIKKGKQAIAMTRLSCHRFRADEVRLWLSVIAYNLGKLWRRLALPTRVVTWSLTSFAAALGQDRRPIDQTVPVNYSVTTGGEPSDATVFRGHTGEDGDAALAGGIK